MVKYINPKINKKTKAFPSLHLNVVSGLLTLLIVAGIGIPLSLKAATTTTNTQQGASGYTCGGLHGYCVNGQTTQRCVNGYHFQQYYQVNKVFRVNLNSTCHLGQDQQCCIPNAAPTPTPYPPGRPACVTNGGVCITGTNCSQQLGNSWKITSDPRNPKYQCGANNIITCCVNVGASRSHNSLRPQ